MGLGFGEPRGCCCGSQEDFGTCYSCQCSRTVPSSGSGCPGAVFFEDDEPPELRCCPELDNPGGTSNNSLTWGDEFVPIETPRLVLGTVSATSSVSITPILMPEDYVVTNFDDAIVTRNGSQIVGLHSPGPGGLHHTAGRTGSPTYALLYAGQNFIGRFTRETFGSSGSTYYGRSDDSPFGWEAFEYNATSGKVLHLHCNFSYATRGESFGFLGTTLTREIIDEIDVDLPMIRMLSYQTSGQSETIFEQNPCNCNLGTFPVFHEQSGTLDTEILLGWSSVRLEERERDDGAILSVHVFSGPITRSRSATQGMGPQLRYPVDYPAVQSFLPRGFLWNRNEDGTDSLLTAGNPAYPPNAIIGAHPNHPFGVFEQGAHYTEANYHDFQYSSTITGTPSEEECIDGGDSCLAVCGNVHCCVDGECDLVPEADCPEGAEYDSESDCERTCGTVWCCDEDLGDCRRVPEEDCDEGYLVQADCEMACVNVWCCREDGGCERVLIEECDAEASHPFEETCLRNCGTVWCCDSQGSCSEVDHSLCSEEDTFLSEGQCNAGCGTIWCCDLAQECTEIGSESFCFGEAYERPEECDAACGTVWCCSGQGNCNETSAEVCDTDNSYTNEEDCIAFCSTENVWCCDEDGNCSQTQRSDCEGEVHDTEAECTDLCGAEFTWCCDGTGNCEEILADNCEGNSYNSEEECQLGCRMVWCCSIEGNCEFVPEDDCEDEGYASSQECEDACTPTLVWCCNENDGDCDEILEADCAGNFYDTEQECDAACFPDRWHCNESGSCEFITNVDPNGFEFSFANLYDTEDECLAGCSSVFCCDGNSLRCDEVRADVCGELNSHATLSECEDGCLGCCLTLQEFDSYSDIVPGPTIVQNTSDVFFSVTFSSVENVLVDGQSASITVSWDWQRNGNTNRNRFEPVFRMGLSRNFSSGLDGHVTMDQIGSYTFDTDRVECGATYSIAFTVAGIEIDGDEAGYDNELSMIIRYGSVGDNDDCIMSISPTTFGGDDDPL